MKINEFIDMIGRNVDDNGHDDLERWLITKAELKIKQTGYKLVKCFKKVDEVLDG